STAPEAPSIGGVYDDVGVKQGELARGEVTDDRKPTLTGTAEEGSLIEIFDNDVKLGETRADSNGNWTFTPAEELAQGEHSFTARATDAAGNLSDASDAWDLVIDFTPATRPVIESVFDDVGPLTGNLHSGDVTDDTRPELSGRSDPNATVIIYNRGVEIGRVEANDEGHWNFTPTADLATGEYSFTTVAMNAAGNYSAPSDPFELIIFPGDGPTQVARVSEMGKDSGYGKNDFVTNNGSFGRLMHGSLSSELTAGQKLEVSTDGGRTWFNALVNGTSWAVQDLNDHAGNWSIQTRVVDQQGNSGYVMQQTVVYDKTAASAPTSLHLENGALDITFNAAQLVAGDRLAIIVNGGPARFEHTLTQSDIDAGAVHLDVGSAQWVSAALVDQAGNISAYTNTAGAPNVIYQITGDVTEVYGLANASTFTLSDVSLLDKISLIEGNGGNDTLRLTGANQVLDLSAWQGRLSSVEIIDITGSGDNTLKLSLGDVLDLGHRSAFINDGAVQLAVKGNAGDKVVLSDLLPNGMDVGHWELLGDVTAAGIAYDVYQSTEFAVELLVQQGVAVQA
ncbi:Ig-like domain-containing protein, partial [Pseudomonas nitroreducens]